MIKAADGWQTNVDGLKGSYKRVSFLCLKKIVILLKLFHGLLYGKKNTLKFVFSLDTRNQGLPLRNIPGLTLKAALKS